MLLWPYWCHYEKSSTTMEDLHKKTTEIQYIMSSPDRKGEPGSCREENSDYNWSRCVKMFAIFKSKIDILRIFALHFTDIHMQHKWRKMHFLALIYKTCKCMGVVKYVREFELELSFYNKYPPRVSIKKR